MGCSQILTVCIHGLQVDLVLISLVYMSFNGMFSDPHFTYTGGSGINQIGGLTQSLKRNSIKIT